MFDRAHATRTSCFDCTDWNVLTDPSKTVDEAVDVVSSYIKFCEDMIIRTKTVKMFPNNKPWVTKSLKTLINEKKKCFKDKAQRKLVQKKLDEEIAKAKREYKEKVEAQFHQGSLSDAWKGLKTISGMENSKSTSEWPIEELKRFQRAAKRLLLSV